MRILLLVLGFMLALAEAVPAFAHASLVKAEPADGAVLAQPPPVARLTFNEPVSPLAMRLITSDGRVMVLRAQAANATVTLALPAALARGTHLLSWRVISADGHPVGGSFVFSIGAATAQPAAALNQSGDDVVRAAIWLTRLMIYAALFIGIGGAFFRCWRLDASAPWFDRTLVSLIVAGLFLTPLSVGLQGLDVLDLPLPALGHITTWIAGLDTAYGVTAVATAFGLFAALFSVEAPRKPARALTAAAMAALGVALALSGHASNAAPQALMRPMVFLHAVCVALWIGALLPLRAGLAEGTAEPVRRFGRTIRWAVAVVVASGAVLAVRQLDWVDALWTTPYGIVLSCKLGLVAVLLALGAADRRRLLPHATRAMLPGVRLCLVAGILALVATWRFTPPPRALAAAPIALHVHGARAMANVTVTPRRARPPQVTVEVLDEALRPLAVKEVTLALANPAAGIEPVRRPAAAAGTALWRVETLPVPVAGRWTLRIELLVGDFERLVLEDEIDLPRLP